MEYQALSALLPCFVFSHYVGTTSCFGSPSYPSRYILQSMQKKNAIKFLSISLLFGCTFPILLSHGNISLFPHHPSLTNHFHSIYHRINEERPIVQAIGRNVQDLVAVLCSASNAELFLRFGQDSSTSNDETTAPEEGSSKTIDAGVKAGTLAILLHSCATNLPLQTPSYAALVFGVECSAPPSHSGFALRCVELGMRCFGRDLDWMMDYRTNEGGDKVEKEERERCQAEQTGGYGNGLQVDAYYRAKLMLRFLAHLTNVGMVAMKQEQGSSNDGNNLSLMGLLQLLVQCACNAASAALSSGRSSLRRASVILASLVLSTIPYLNLEDVGTSVVDLLDELEAHVLGQTYCSDYEPGVGWQAILLKGELDDGDVMDEEEEDDDDDEEDSDSPAPSCADTLQDLLRTVRKLTNASSQNVSVPSRFALLRDAPWKAVKISAATEGMDVEGSGATGENMIPMTYSGEPLLLDLVGSEEDKICKCVPYILSLDGSDNDGNELNCRLLDGVVFGRLAIFDAPPDPDDEEENEEEESTEKDPNLDSYVKSFSLVDRFFLADAIRDVLMCHRPMVTDAGADRSTAKEVAQQVLMISHLFYPESSPTLENEDSMASSDNADVSKGIEYGIVETLLSLIVQSSPRECGIPASSALNQHLYLARILLELTKLKPALVPRAIVRAISGMFEDFIPSLTPVARTNLATWLAIHLFNTDFQWPKSFWDHWATYVKAGPNRNSRGDFVKVVLQSMASLSSDGAVTIVKDCLPPNSQLAQSIFLDIDQGNSPSAEEQDLADRLWNLNDDPESIRQYVISDELTHSSDAINDGSEDQSMFHSSVWWRTRLATRALFHPMIRDQERERRLVATAMKHEDVNGGDELMKNDDHTDQVDPSEDILSDISDAISRCKPVILAALAKDADAYDSIASGRLDDDELLLAGETCVLKEFGNALPSWDITTLNVLVQCLMKNKIVSALAVATWTFGEKFNSTLHPQWWKILLAAVDSTVANIEGPSSDLGGGIGMIIDDVANDEGASEAAAKRLEEALNAIVPALKYIVEQTSNLLTKVDGDKKVPPIGADVTEGIKRLFSATVFIFFHRFCLEQPIGMQKLSYASVLKGLSDIDLGNDKLSASFQASASDCKSDQGAKLLQSLSKSFEKMV